MYNTFTQHNNMSSIAYYIKKNSTYIPNTALQCYI